MYFLRTNVCLLLLVTYFFAHELRGLNHVPARGKLNDSGEGASGKQASLQEVALHCAQGAALDAGPFDAGQLSWMETMVFDIVCEAGVAVLLGLLGRGLVPEATDCDITACFHEHANSVRLVVTSGQEERGIPVDLVSDVDIALILDEQLHHVRAATAGRTVQRSQSARWLIIDRCPLRDESLGICQPPIAGAGPQK